MFRVLRGLQASAASSAALASAALLSSAAAYAAPPAQYKDTEVYSWGSATFGETGHGHESTGEAVPSRIDALRGRNVVCVSSTGSGVSSAALTADGSVYTWGCGRDARLGHGDAGAQNQLTPRLVEGLPTVVSVAMGEYHGAALTAEGKVYSFGKRAVGHENGKLGVPNLVKGLDGIKVTSLSCGREHTLAVTQDGEVYGWGINASHALGTGTKDDLKVATKLPGLAGKRIVAVAAGREHSLFLTDMGEVYACGTEFFGQCGQSMAVPYVKSPTLVRGALAGKKVIKIVAGEYHSVAICDDDTIYLWGFNRDGTLGHGDRADVGSPRLLEAKLDGRVVAVSGGGGHTLFLTDKNTVYAVGRGRSGQLGRGGGVESIASGKDTPVVVPAVSALVDRRVVQIAAGRDHSLAVVSKLN